MPVLFCERTVQRDNIRFSQKCVKICVLHIKILCRIRVVCKDFHAESFCDADCNPADFSGADNSECLAVQIHAHKAGEGEVEFPCPHICMCQLSDKREEKGERMFGNSMRAVCRNSHDRNAFFIRILVIDIVEAGRTHGDETDAFLTEDVDDSSVNRAVDKRADHIRTFCHDCTVGIQRRLEVYDLKAVIPVCRVKMLFIIIFGVKKNYFHVCHSPASNVMTNVP